MSKDKHKCPYDNLTEEELGTLSWLSSVVTQGAQRRNPTAKKFRDAHAAMGKLLKVHNDQHALLHKRDAELRQAEIITAGLLGLSPTVRENGTVN